MTLRYVKLKVIMKVELNCQSSRTKPDTEIDHAPSLVSLWRTIMC